MVLCPAARPRHPANRIAPAFLPAPRLGMTNASVLTGSQDWPPRIGCIRTTPQGPGASGFTDEAASAGPGRPRGQSALRNPGRDGPLPGGDQEAVQGTVGPGNGRQGRGLLERPATGRPSAFHPRAVTPFFPKSFVIVRVPRDGCVYGRSGAAARRPLGQATARHTQGLAHLHPPGPQVVAQIAQQLRAVAMLQPMDHGLARAP